MCRGMQIVDAIGQVKLKGNIVDREWYNHIRNKDGRCNMNAIEILAELFFLYTPTYIYDEHGKIVGKKKKFRGDLLQKSYEHLGKRLHISKKQVMNACHYLRDEGYIFMEKRSMYVEALERQVANILYIGLNVEKIKSISSAYIPQEYIEDEEDKELESSPAVPVGSGAVPVGSGAVPVGSGAVPVGSVTVPVGSVTVPVGSVTVPVGSVTVPVGSVTVPVGSVTVPVGSVTVPVGSVTVPVGSVTVPVGSVTVPVGSVTVPVGSVTVPVGHTTYEHNIKHTYEHTYHSSPCSALGSVCSPNGSQTEPDSKWGGACAENSEHAEFWNENETGEVSLPDGNGEFSGAVECTGSAELPHEGHGRHTSPTPPSQSNHASRFVDDFMGSISATPENQGSDVAPGLRERATEIPKSTQPPESCVISQEKKGSAQNEPIRSSGEIGIVVETEHKPTHPPPSQNAKPTPQELGYPPTWRSNAMRDALERSIEIAFLRYDEGAYMTGDIGRMRRDIARISKFCRTMGEKFKKDASRIAQALFGAFLRLRESKEFWRQKACTPSTMAGQTCLGECWQLCKEMMEEYKKAERQIRTKAEEHPKYVNRWLGRYEWGEVTDEEREAYIKAKLNDKIQKIRGVKHE